MNSKGSELRNSGMLLSFNTCVELTLTIYLCFCARVRERGETEFSCLFNHWLHICHHWNKNSSYKTQHSKRPSPPPKFGRSNANVKYNWGKCIAVQWMYIYCKFTICFSLFFSFYKISIFHFVSRCRCSNSVAVQVNIIQIWSTMRYTQRVYPVAIANKTFVGLLHSQCTNKICNSQLNKTIIHYK